MSDRPLPLEGVRVVELCCPMVGQHLDDLGAEVVKVEWFDCFDRSAEACDLAATETSSEFEGMDVRQESTHPVSGSRRLVAAPWRMGGHRPPIQKPAPLLGESNEHVLRDLLGLDDDRVRAVHESGVVDERGR